MRLTFFPLQRFADKIARFALGWIQKIIDCQACSRRPPKDLRWWHIDHGFVSRFSSSCWRKSRYQSYLYTPLIRFLSPPALSSFFHTCVFGNVQGRVQSSICMSIILHPAVSKDILTIVAGCVHTNPIEEGHILLYVIVHEYRTLTMNHPFHLYLFSIHCPNVELPPLWMMVPSNSSVTGCFSSSYNGSMLLWMNNNKDIPSTCLWLFCIN